MSGPVWETISYFEDEAIDPARPPQAEEDKRSRSLARARKNLRRKINANAGQWYDEKNGRFFMPLFLTLTFAENVTDVATANKEFHRFMLRLNRGLFQTSKGHIKYAVVIEFQERGAVHYHALFFNIPFMDNLKSIIETTWGHGFVFLTSIKHVDNIGAYVTKYMTKDMSDERLLGKKAYFCSKFLIKPQMTTDEDEISANLSLLRDITPDIFELPGMEYRRYKVGAPYRYWPLHRKEPEWVSSLPPATNLFTGKEKSVESKP